MIVVRAWPPLCMLFAAGCTSNWTVRQEPMLGHTGPQVERRLGKPDRVVTLEDKAERDANGLVTRTRVVAKDGPQLPLPDWSAGHRWTPGRKDVWCWGSSTFVVFATGVVSEVWAMTGYFGLGELQLVQIEKSFAGTQQR